MPRPEFVRVRLENGAHKSIPAHRAEALKLPTLKQEALGRDGRPRPTKHRTDKSGAAVATTTPTSEAADASESKED